MDIARQVGFDYECLKPAPLESAQVWPVSGHKILNAFERWANHLFMHPSITDATHNLLETDNDKIEDSLLFQRFRRFSRSSPWMLQHANAIPVAANTAPQKTIEKGKRADLVVVAGDPTRRIEDIEKVELVFKADSGFDPAKLTQSVKGFVGLR